MFPPRMTEFAVILTQKKIGGKNSQWFQVSSVVSQHFPKHPVDEHIKYHEKNVRRFAGCLSIQG